ncbi:Flp pilus assembly protein TadD, contains TPR repeats [Nitrosomonas sp. Nm51]|uniref:FecR domain-containing protein n=1 Tax=Nitrosomonas sp. Nm51 TaxID=133720 RepID=UPI0008B076C8|nr:FecR domain-containing protein [Nitrosomonas sp. Nm51]SER02249.1 Flp pilus assembly protein TadD, contains TPR repeats [Nitrosomonas sp. Nm51]
MSISETAVKRTSSWLVLLAFAVLATVPVMLARNAIAADVCAVNAALVVSVQGDVELRRAQSTLWESARLDTPLCAGDSLRVRRHGRASIRLSNDSLMRLDQRSAITIPQTDANKITSFVDLIEGAIHIITRTPRPFKIRTPFLNAGVEGTEFFVRVQSDFAQIIIFEGRVSAENTLGSLSLTDHEAAVAYRNLPPQKETVVEPLDAVQWTLHYPAIIGYHRGRLDTAETDFTSRLQEAEQLLSVGRAQEAGSIIGSILTKDPDNSAAIALQSIIAVVQNDKQTALELAKRAVAYDELSAAARLALSYAQQASFDIEAALASVKQAVVLDPQNALIWARLAELQMSVGELEQALASAQEAVGLNPAIAKTQTVLGFAYLLQIDTADAKSVFHDAILLDQADPMPRLGLGLSLIREGRLEAGRIELEIAASLDPGNSLIRSYLGKAYFEEKRYSIAETQFELARERDPNDPTPWFYGAIQKQTQNRPVEALRDIQKSIELNGNRAVYRSRLLLDQDQAGRGSSLARIYDNLGFEKRALMETAKSLAYDPSNHSAHRFLSDTYANTPRHEIARVSELLQAQLLQPINVNPVQPRLAVADLNIITNTGPAVTGFNEFTPLVERNRAQLVASGIVGSNGTIGDEVVASALYDRASMSIGQFHYGSDGFRPNNDQKHNIYNAFLQYAVTSKFNLQAEVRRRETTHGDLLLDFDPGRFDPNQRRRLEQDTARVGGRYALSPDQDIIFSAAYFDRKENLNFAIPGFDPATNDIVITPLLNNTKEKAYLVEGQYHYRQEHLNIIMGTGTYRSDAKNQQNIPLVSLPDNFIRERQNGYLYSNFNQIDNVSITLGLSYDALKDSAVIKENKFNPKFGLQWSFLDRFRMRLAFFETVKSALFANQTLEPTQVAGFNQFFDDFNGTRAQRKGIGLDAQLTKNILSGIEVSSRDLKVPVIQGMPQSLELDTQKQKEQLYRGYFYLLPHKFWAIRSEAQLEKFSRRIMQFNQPTRIETLSVPVSINYFNPHGLFAKLTGTFVRQEIDRTAAFPGAAPTTALDNFFLLDTTIGYRFPNRMGLVSFEGRNLLNEHFFFRNVNFYVSEAINPRFIPTRTFFARVTLNF